MHLKQTGFQQKAQKLSEMKKQFCFVSPTHGITGHPLEEH